MNYVFTVSVVVAFVLFVQNAEARVVSASRRNQVRIIHLHENKENFKQNKCGAPRPELHYIGEDSDTEQYAGMQFYPPAVVVNRCSRTTGCCANGGRCTVDTEEKVIFQVEAVFDGVTAELSVPITNHISCKCTIGKGDD